jgi:hypothetical protein
MRTGRRAVAGAPPRSSSRPSIPAHDVILRLDDLAPGVVHRVASDAVFSGVGGKAVNVALAVAAMHVPVRLRRSS